MRSQLGADACGQGADLLVHFELGVSDRARDDPLFTLALEVVVNCGAADDADGKAREESEKCDVRAPL